MTPHAKKLIGTIGTLVWLAIYSLVAAAIGIRVLPHANWLVMVAYYLLAGTLWIIPVGLALPWMHREPKPKRPREA